MNLVTPAAWCAAFFLAATLFSHTVALRLILLLAGIFLLIAAAVRMRLRSATDGIAFVPPLLWPFVLWAAWAALSLLWSLDPAMTSKELRNEIVYTFLALCLCHAGAQAANAARIVLAVMALGAIAVCAVALQYFWLGPPENAGWPHGGPGTYSSTLLILFPCTLAFAWLAARKRWHAGFVALATLLLPLYAISGYATQNRTLWIGFAVQIAIIAPLVLLRRSHGVAPGRRMQRLVAMLAVLAIAGSGAMSAKVHQERFGSIPDAAANDSRFPLWQSVLRRIQEHPLAGSGFGRGIARHELRDETGNRQLWHSHSLFLDTALQLGWTGMALLLLLLGWTVRLAWRLARSSDEVAFACGLALLAVVAGTVIRNLTDVLWVRQSALLYWGVVGTLLAWGMRAARPGVKPAR